MRFPSGPIVVAIALTASALVALSCGKQGKACTACVGGQSCNAQACTCPTGQVFCEPSQGAARRE